MDSRTNMRYIFLLLIAFFSFYNAFGQLVDPTPEVNSLKVEVFKSNPCGGDDNGSITFNVISASGSAASIQIIGVGGNPNFSLLSPRDVPVGDSFVFSGTAGLIEGQYSILLNDDDGSLFVPNEELTNISDINIVSNTSSNNTSCAVLNGEINITVDQGSADLTDGGIYVFEVTATNGFTDNGSAAVTNGGSANIDFTGLAGGTYTVDIQDSLSSCGLIAPLSFTISDPSPSLQTITTASPLNICNGGDAILTLANSESGIDYTIYIDGTPQVPIAASTRIGDGTSDFQLTAPSGSFADGDNLVVIAVNGFCTPVQMTGTVEADINFPTDAVLSGTAAICEGETANLTVTITGGTGPYDIVLDNGSVFNDYVNGTATLAVAPTTNTTFNLSSVTDNNGCVATNLSGSVTVTVNEAPTSATLSGAATICTGEIANFSVEIIGGLSPYTVILDNGAGTFTNYTSGDPIPVTATGNLTYNITSVIDDNGCRAKSESGTASIGLANPTTAVLGSNSAICEGDATDLSVVVTGGVAPYDIVLNDGTSDILIDTYNSGDPISVNPTTTTTYTLVSATDGDGCRALSESGTATITVTALPTVTAASGSVDVCDNDGSQDLVTQVSVTPAGGTLTFAGTGVAGNTFSPIGQGGNTITITATYVLGSCTVMTTFDYAVLEEPTITLPTTAIPICENASPVILNSLIGTQITANPTGGTFEFPSNPSGEFDPSGLSGTVNVPVTYFFPDRVGAICEVTEQLQFSISPIPSPTISGEFDVCFEDVEEYVTQPGQSDYIWVVEGGTIDDGGELTDNTITIAWDDTDPHSISVSYTDTNSCSPSAPTQQIVTVSPLPTPTISGNMTASCSGFDEVYTTEPGQNNYVWGVLGGTVVNGGTATDNTVTVNWGTIPPFSIRVNYQNAGNCEAISPTLRTVIVNTAPTPTITGELAVCAGDSESYGTEPGQSDYVWTVTGGSITGGGSATDNTVTVLWDGSAPFGVSVNYENATGCGAGTATNQVITVDVLPVISAPSSSIELCESAGIQNLNDLVNATPNTGVFSFSGTGVTGSGFNPIGQGGNTINVNYDYVLGACTVSGTFDYTIVTSPVVNLPSPEPTVCASSGVIDLTTLVSASPNTGTFTFTGTNVIGANFDPTGLGGTSVSIGVEYSLGSCTINRSFNISIVDGASLTLPTSPVGVCESGGVLDLSTLVTALPTGGTFTFGGTGVTGSNFDPIGLTGTIMISVDYDLSGCTATGTFDIDILSDPALTVPATATEVCESDAPIDLESLVTASPIGGTLTFTGTNVTGSSLDPSGEAGNTLIIGATYTLGGCVVNASFDISVLSGPTLTATVMDNTSCSIPYNGDIDIEVSPASGTYTFEWIFPDGSTSSSPNLFPFLEPGEYTLTVTDDATSCSTTEMYRVGGELPSIILPTPSPQVCESGGTIDLTTLITGNPTGGVFTFSGPGVSGSDFEPSGLSGAQNISVDYRANGCDAPQETLVVEVITTAAITVPITNTAICETASAIDLSTLVSASPSGGTFTFTGAGISGNNFNPSGLFGNQTIMVEYSIGGCTAPNVLFEIEVVNTSTITVPTSSVNACEASGNIDLTTLVTASPAGGSFTFNGVGVAGNDFNPTGLSGLQTITVDYNLMGGCNAAQQTFIIDIGTNSSITVPATSTDICATGGAVDLTALVSAVPSGGTFTFAGPGVTGSSFDPIGLSGLQTVTVDYDISGSCAAVQRSLALNITNTATTVVPTSTVETCDTGAPIDLSALVSASPSGGTLTFTGAGVSGDIFTPTGLSGLQTVTVEYSIGGCASPTESFTVNVGTTSAITVAPAEVCSTGGAVDLLSFVTAVPSGGTFTFTGAGVTGSSFDPSGLSGTQSVTVEYSIGGGCSAAPLTLSVDIVDDAALTVLSPNTEACATGAPIDLSALVSASPSGGTFTFTGTGVTGSSFDPTGLSGAQTVTVGYSIGGCAAPAESLRVTVVPNSSITVPATSTDICATGGAVDLTALVSAVPSGGTFTFAGPGVTGSSFDPIGLSGLQTVTVDYDISGSCAAVQRSLALNVTSTASIIAPSSIIDVCATAGSFDLTSIVSASPSGGTLTFSGLGVTGTQFDGIGLSGIQTITVEYSAAGCVAVPQTFDINVTDVSTINVPSTPRDICEFGGIINLEDLVSASPSGGSFSFIGPGVSGSSFDPAGLTGIQSISVNYNFGASCVASTATLELNVSNTATVTVPPTVTTVCQNGGVVNLLTLVSASPAGGTFSFSGTGVSGSSFDPTGLTGVVSIMVDYSFSGCNDSKTFDFNVLLSTDPLCASVGGDCATVRITPMPNPATCTNSDGSVFFEIDPATPAINTVGVIIDITGPISRTNFNDPLIEGIPVGLYNYTITYGDPSCIKTGTFTIDQSGTVGTPVASSIVNATCFGEPTGAVTIDIPGETGNLLEWSIDGINFTPFLAGSQITGISPGIAPTFERIISIRRNASDPCNAAVTVLLQNEFSEITATITPNTDATCNNNDGSVTVTDVAGGDNSTGYNFLLDGIPFALPADGRLSGLSGGNHTLTIIDNQDCRKVFPILINSPGLVLFSSTTVAPTCTANGGDGQIAVQIDPAFLPGSYEVALTRESGGSAIFEAIPSSGFFRYDNLGGGDYFITVRSDDGCPNEQLVTITGGPSALTFNTAIVCASNNAQFLAVTEMTGEIGVDVTYEINRRGNPNIVDSGTIPFPPTREFTIGEDVVKAWLLQPDEYQIRLIQNQTVCPSEISSVPQGIIVRSILSAEAIPLKSSLPDRATGSFIVQNFTGGLAPYEILVELAIPSSPDPDPAVQEYIKGWDVVEFNPRTARLETVFTQVPPGDYDVMIRDSESCEIVLNNRVTVALNTEIFIPNVFTPNDDLVNDSFEIRNLDVDNAKMVISNRWGKEVYSSDDYRNNLWTADGVADGVYFYRLEVEGEFYSGWIEVIRGKKP